MKYLSIDDYKDIQGRTLKDIIKGKNQFLIPPYQRDFDWNVDDYDNTALVNDFLKSLEELTANEDNEFFFGQIVVAKNGDNSKEAYIIDGQQRLTTFFILIHCIASRITDTFISSSAKYFKEDEILREGIPINEDDHENIRSLTSIIAHIKEGEFHSWFLNKDKINDSSLHARIKLQNDKHTHVWPIIFNNNCSIIEANKLYEAAVARNEKFSNGDDKLFAAYKYINGWVNGLSLKDLIDVFSKALFTDNAPRVHAVLMDVSTLDTGINIFHGINAKGKQLGPTDLVKAQMCRVGEDHPSSASSPMSNDMIKEWMNLFEDYEKDFNKVFPGREEVFVSFILNYIYSKYDEDDAFDYRISEKTLFNVYQAVMTKPDHVDRELQRIKALSRIFFLMNDADTCKKGFRSQEISNTSKRKKINDMLVRMHGFLKKSVQHYRIFLLAFHELADDPEAELLTFNKEGSIAVDTLVILMERVYSFLIIAKITEMKPQEQRDPIKKATKEINERIKEMQLNSSFEDKCANVLEATTERLRNYDAQNNDISKRLETQSYPRSKSATFVNNLLWEIEYYLQGKSEFAKEMLKARTVYDGDHIMPEAYSEWEEFYSTDVFETMKLSYDLLGNRCPLNHKENRSARNKPLNAKLPMYLKDDLKIHDLLLEALKEVYDESNDVDSNLFSPSNKNELKQLIVNNEFEVNHLWNNKCMKVLGKKYAEKILEVFPNI